MKKIRILWLILTILPVFFISCDFFKTVSKSEYAKASGKDNANLSMLAVPPCVLSEPFSKYVTNYSVSVPSNISSIAVIAGTEIRETILKVNGISTEKNRFSDDIDVSSLNSGESVIITIEVKTEYFNTTKNYYITAIKSAGSLSFNEGFETGNFSKYGWVTNGEKLFVQSNIKYQDQYAVKFGFYDSDNKPYLRIKISNSTPVTLSFYYLSNPDIYWFSVYLGLYIDNNLINSFKSSNWTQYSTVLAAGNHIISWEIISTLSYGSYEYGFIDNIQIQ